MWAGSSGENSVDTDVLYSVLAAPERRTVLRELTANGPSRTISELVEGITESTDEYPEADGNTLRVALHHQHLPRMAEAGVIDYDTENGEVTLTPTGEQAEAVRRRTAEFLDGL